MADLQELHGKMENIRQLREKLKVANRENKSLKQQLSSKEEILKRHVMKHKSEDADKRFVHKFLHSHLGAEVTIKDSTIEVYFKPYCSGVPQRQYLMVLQTGDNAWQVVGYDLPLSITKRQGTKIHSMEQLGEFIREVTKEVQAYAERKYQVSNIEEIFKKVNASIWYTTKFQTLFLSLPMAGLTSGTNLVCELELNYEVSHILPYRVTADVKGLDAVKKERLNTRMENLLKHFSLLTAMKEEFEKEPQDDSAMSSILGNLSP